MTTLDEPVPRRRVPWLWRGLAGVLLLVSLYGLSWWLFVLKPRWDEMRVFVGTWRLESPSPISPTRPELVEEMDLLFDGTIINRIWDPKIGVIALNQPSLARWHSSNGRFQEVIHGYDRLHDLVEIGGRTYVIVDSPVTWDGPDRFSVQGPLPKAPTMTWARSESVTGLPRTHVPMGPE